MARININNGAGKWYDEDEVEQVLEQIDLETVSVYMDDDIRAEVAYEKAPCTDAEFLAEYLRRAPADLVIG